MAPLSNYLRTHRKRLTLSQEEVAFLLGMHGRKKGSKVSRSEDPGYVPLLQTALAYEAIYGRPVRELFAGLYGQVEREVSARAKVLNHKTTGKPNAKRQEAITRLVSKAAG